MGLLFFSLRFAATAQSVQGTVVDVRKVVRDSVGYIYTVAFFDDESQQAIRLPVGGTDSVHYETGDEVTMLYQAGNPRGAVMQNFSSQYAAGTILSGMGVFFLLMGGGPLLWYSRKNRRHRRLLKTGIPIQTQFNRVDYNTTITVNGRSPYVVVSHKRDPINGTRIWEFKSLNLWFDPTPYIDSGKSITVYVDPENYKRYAMDMSQLPRIQ